MVCCFCALFDGIQCHIVIQHHFNNSPTIQHISADQAVELRNNKVCYMTACDSLKHTAVFRSVGCRAAIPPVTEEMRVGKSVLAGIVQKGLYLPILSVEFVLLAAVDAAIKCGDFSCCLFI